jgi:hypothetical protein
MPMTSYLIADDVFIFYSQKRSVRVNHVILANILKNKIKI